MTHGPDGRARATILGGFLGSGKTTWLRHQLHVRRFERAFVIVNEAARTPIDDALLGESHRLAVVADGCACCDGKARLVSLLREICDERSRTDSRSERLEHIVIETSGLADPAPIVAAIRDDPVLVHHVVLSEIVVMVDAVNAWVHLRSEPLGRRQVEVADRLIVTKAEEVETHELARLFATLKHLNPAASISAATWGSEVELPPLGRAAPEVLPTLEGMSQRLPLFPASISLGPNVDWTVFAVWLSALLHARSGDVMRVKGVIRTPAGRLLLQAVRCVVQAPEILPDPGKDCDFDDDTIVVIGRGYREEELTRSLEYFARMEQGNSKP
jgi:G3E family GTPase